MAAFSVVVVGSLVSACGGSSSLPKPTFTAEGELLRPDPSFREWVYIGTPLTPNDLNPPAAPFPEFHNVYMHPADFEHWSETGTLPDGTVIVKELVTVGSNSAVSGNGYFMGGFVGLEATVKDRDRFPDEPGNWAYFSFGHEYPLAETAPLQPVSACNFCHEANGTEDFVFTEYYPVLRAAKPGSDGAIATRISQAVESGGSTAALTGDDVVPTEADQLFEYLQAGRYRGFASEDEAHTSVGPHPSSDLQSESLVRAFFNSAADTSLRAGNGTHPQGSAIVKEFYDGDGGLIGWAVAVKTEPESANGTGWYWYEVLSTTDSSDPVAAGYGVPLCWGCHAGGRDFVLSDYP